MKHFWTVEHDLHSSKAKDFTATGMKKRSDGQIETWKTGTNIDVEKICLMQIKKTFAGPEKDVLK